MEGKLGQGELLRAVERRSCVLRHLSVLRVEAVSKHVKRARIVLIALALLDHGHEHFGATVAERLACSPPSMSIRAQPPARSLRIFACGNLAGRCRWSTSFLRDLPFPRPFHSDASPYSPQSPTSALKTSLLRVAKISSLQSDEAPGLWVCVALIAPSHLDLGRGVPTGIHPTLNQVGVECREIRGLESRRCCGEVTMEQRRNARIPEKTRQPAATFPTCENLGSYKTELAAHPGQYCQITFSCSNRPREIKIKADELTCHQPTRTLHIGPAQSTFTSTKTVLFQAHAPLLSIQCRNSQNLPKAPTISELTFGGLPCPWILTPNPIRIHQPRTHFLLAGDLPGPWRVLHNPHNRSKATNPHPPFTASPDCIVCPTTSGTLHLPITPPDTRALAYRQGEPGLISVGVAPGNRAGRCRWSAGFLGDLSSPPAIPLRRCSILMSLHIRWLPRVVRRRYKEVVFLASRDRGKEVRDLGLSPADVVSRPSVHTTHLIPSNLAAGERVNLDTRKTLGDREREMVTIADVSGMRIATTLLRINGGYASIETSCSKKEEMVVECIRKEPGSLSHPSRYCATKFYKRSREGKGQLLHPRATRSGEDRLFMHANYLMMNCMTGPPFPWVRSYWVICALTSFCKPRHPATNSGLEGWSAMSRYWPHGCFPVIGSLTNNLPYILQPQPRQTKLHLPSATVAKISQSLLRFAWFAVPFYLDPSTFGVCPWLRLRSSYQTALL
ncbi:hypothetical protein PR048_007536 [Dryococelus australis]|uniref:Uncharacterized protein n=1 Tax=Dryococelus australis TaxID=614101 RepID=A0ABQ9HUS8_9NEOP|nr:hypothetical protein PR048_007536 [Dryococelus australis]